MRNLWPYLLLVTLLLVAALLLAACGALGAPAGAEPADSPTPTLAVPPAGEEAATVLPPSPTGSPFRRCRIWAWPRTSATKSG